MKKLFVFFSIFLISIVCSSLAMAVKPPEGINKETDYVIFGSYEQYDRHEYLGEGKIFDTLMIDTGIEPIQWIVLKQDGNELLLLAKDPIEYRQFSKERKKGTWKNSAIRSFLNGEFIRKAFSADEQKAILKKEISTGGSAVEKNWYKAPLEKTEDKVFLLSYSELKQFLKTDTIEVNDYVHSKDAHIFGADNSWWLRSAGKKEDEALYVGHGKNESGWLSDWRGIRPAMWIDISLVNWENSIYVTAKKAEALYKEKKYTEAYAITDHLDGYMDSKVNSAYYRILYAKQASDEHDYPTAIERYNAAMEYINSSFTAKNDHNINEQQTLIKCYQIKECILDCNYNWAIQKMEEEDYPNAIRMFTEIGQYKKSMELLRACYDRSHIKYYWFDEKAVNVGNDYKKHDSIDRNDLHSGWYLGRFMLSGYTEAKEESSIPVFMKTPGDNLTLWFCLEQDIDALNGKKELTINNDKDGYDQEFDVRDNFGRGTLIVQHQTKNNSTKGPQRYSDFLVAQSGTGADTKIEIKEEGTYKVALDYEVRKDELFDKINNYRIAFTFKVKNGSGMFFLFDMSNNSELQDYSRTADGFRIDLANSHSLSVSYKRYAINQDETALDVRKSGLASDGDTFEKVGYYEITVTNTETNQELTKHIFVGRAADLEEYQAIDNSLGMKEKNTTWTRIPERRLKCRVLRSAS